MLSLPLLVPASVLIAAAIRVSAGGEIRPSTRSTTSRRSSSTRSSLRATSAPGASPGRQKVRWRSSSCGRARRSSLQGWHVASRWGSSSYSGAEYAYYTATSALSSLALSHALRPAYSLEVIAPASAKQIARSRPQPGVLIAETPELYHAVTAPYIDALDPRSVAWIGNVLNLSKEAERVLYNDEEEATGFLLNVDTKWKSHPDCATTERASWYRHKAVDDLYCLAICHRRDVRSLRDLTAAHLPLLRHILAKGRETMCGRLRRGGGRAARLRALPAAVLPLPRPLHAPPQRPRLPGRACTPPRRHHRRARGRRRAFTRRRTLHYQLKANDALLAKIRQHENGAAGSGRRRAAASPRPPGGGARQRAPPGRILAPQGETTTLFLGQGAPRSQSNRSRRSCSEPRKGSTAAKRSAVEEL